MIMGVAWWVVMCVVGVVLGAQSGPDRPDITMLYKGNTKFCVAGGNTNGYGLAFMSETIEDDVNIKDFEYKYGSGATIDSSSDCDFERSPGDTCWDRWRSNDIRLLESGSYPTSPVTDERWNNFAIYRTVGKNKKGAVPPEYNERYIIKQENFFTGISVRANENAQILLCSGANKQPQKDACYWLIIDGFKNFDLTVMRKCTKGVPNSSPDHPECSKFRANINTPEKLLHESRWTHFMLSRDGGNRVRLWLWDLDTGARPLLDYMDDDPLPLTTMYVRSYNTIAEWKIHQYKYVYLVYKRGPIRLGPILYFSYNSDICISFYVTMCPKCRMYIKLEKEGGITEMDTRIQGDSDGPFMTWKNVRLQGGVSLLSTKQYVLYVTLSTTDGRNENTFWAIDDFRKCSNNEIRVASIASKTKLLCQSLKHPGWTFNPNLQINNKDEPPVCSNPWYIGQHCNISCSSANPNDGCSGQKICLSTQEASKGACTCAAGYMWGSSGCTQPCNYGYYGYNCEQKCGHCKNTACYINIGICPEGCEDGYISPFCQTTYPRLAYPPVVDKIFVTNITMKFNNLEVIGDKDNAYEIQLECMKAIGWSSWVDCGEPIKFSPGQEISITGLEKETTYLIRAIVYNKTGYTYLYDNLPTVEVTTMCKVDREIYVTVTSRNATISFETEKDDCSLINYKIELQQNGKQIKSQQGVWHDFILPNLTPYTDYNITVTNILFPSYIENRSFQTKEDAPSEIKDLSISETTATTIVLSWKEPDETNGVIKKYIVTYQLLHRIECNGNLIAQINTVTIYPPIIYNVILSDLQPYSTYNISVIAETILPGPPTELQANTSMMNEISEEELPDTISISNLSAQWVTIRWPVNCVKQRGPLYFQLVLKCVQDAWCDQIQDIVSDDVYSINGGYTTHELTPFTHYSVQLRGKRSQNGDLTTFSRTTELYAPAGAPPAVRNATHYSRNSVSISLRWLEPYPPHGHLEKFAIKYCPQYRACRTTEITTNQLTPCDLWSEKFNCYKLINLLSNTQHTITIRAQNKEAKGWSPDENPLTVSTAEGKSSAPLNLTREWVNNEIKLFWNHPDNTNGDLKKFIITLNQTGTELENQDEKPLYSYEDKVLNESMTYSYTINKTYQYSSSYIVTVCGMNSLYGENATLHIDTPPEIPELAGDVTVFEEEATNTTVKIKIPGAKNNTKSRTSFLYVVVSKTDSSMSKRQAQEENLLAQEIRSRSSFPNSWIAIERDLNEAIFQDFILGDGSQSDSKHLNEIIRNRELEPSTIYDVTIILINQYRGEKSFKDYHQTVETIATIIPTSLALLALLLLLLLPVIGYFVYRYVIKKETRRVSMMMMIPGLRVTRTEASNEAEHNKPKKPAITPKPGPSTKLPEIPTSAEVNTTGTTFFHSRIVLLENLEDYLKEALENGDLDEQHALFPRGQTKPWDYGMLKPNKFKNRYSNLIAYDKNRVKLEKINNDQYSDYINASYIHGYRQDKAYIATQGPKLATLNDFWRMIWQEKTIYIVMLANVVEAGKKKCEKYWPEIDSSREYGFVDVYFERSEVYADYEYRTFELTCNGEKRKVTQLHFTSWPDHGVPLYPQSLVPFLKKMLTIPQSSAPVVVHCSAGVGRTGTIILCDICLRMAAREKSIDALRYLHEIREQRANMVDNIDQYKLVHMVLLECLLAPDTNIPCNADLSNSIQKLIEEGGLQIQLNYLQQSSWQDKALNFASTKQPNPVNESKNRYNDIVPLENQVYISRYPVDDENSDYINAVPVDGFRFKEQFIVTQTPMPNTVKDFWRMIAEKSVRIIVSLNDIPPGDQTSCVFWPAENEEMKPVPNINLKHHKLQSFDYYDLHSIVLDDKSANDCSMIQIVQFKNWSHDSKLPRSEDNLVMLWEETENLSHGNYPMVVTCYDGATASGLFVAMSFVIEKIKLEQQCDPCLAVRVVRRNRKQFVSNKMQFEFLYRSAVIYLSMFETYSNFQPVVNKQNK